MTDAKYAELEVPVCEVKDIQNIPFGVNSFWLKAMLANREASQAIFEKDRPILGYLQDVTLDLHEQGYGYDLTFHFEKNSYFKETSLRKSFHMSQQNVIEKCVGTPITWNGGCDVTQIKKKKGKGNKKKTVVVKCESFFNFFGDIDVSTIKETKPKHDDDEEEPDQDKDAE